MNYLVLIAVVIMIGGILWILNARHSDKQWKSGQFEISMLWMTSLSVVFISMAVIYLADYFLQSPVT